MRMTLKEIIDTCQNWEAFCDMKGYDYSAVNEGGGHIEVELTTKEAHDLGIVKLPDWKVNAENQWTE